MSHPVWSRLRKKLQKELDPDEYSVWFRPLKVASEDRSRLVLVAPNERFLHTLEESYRPAVNRAIADLGDRPVEVLFSLDSEDGAPRPSSPAGQEASGQEAPAQTSPRPAAPGRSSQDTGTQDESPAQRPIDSDRKSSNWRASARRDVEKTTRAAAEGNQFNPRYIFESFVVGASNQFAHAAAEAVAESPFHSYNPLFLYGGVGLGKTHLLHAIGHRILERNPRLRVLYLAAEQFVNELINSIRFDRMPAFRERYRTIDVLLVDDVQFLANKERTQEEFFHTFNTLYTSQKQIILSSDSSPRNIPTLEERLRSRFEWGLIADIQPPDLETKVAILRRKAEIERIYVPDEVAEFIARQVRSNIRELEGLLNRVLAFSSLTGREVTLDLTKETLKDILPDQDRRPQGQEIVKVVAHRYGLKVGEIKSKSNSRQIVFPRQVAMYVCKRLTELSYPDIGKLFNNKHHSTVMHSVDKIDQLRSEDPDLDRTLEEIEQHFA